MVYSFTLVRNGDVEVHSIVWIRVIVYQNVSSCAVFNVSVEKAFCLRVYYAKAWFYFSGTYSICGFNIFCQDKLHVVIPFVYNSSF